MNKKKKQIVGRGMRKGREECEEESMEREGQEEGG